MVAVNMVSDGVEKFKSPVGYGGNHFMRAHAGKGCIPPGNFMASRGIHGVPTHFLCFSHKGVRGKPPQTTWFHDFDWTIWRKRRAATCGERKERSGKVNMR